MVKFNYRIFYALFILLSSSLACSLVLGEDESIAVATSVPVETIEKLNNQIVETLENSSQGEIITLSFTEDQLTDIITSELAKQSDPLLQDPQVTLEGGQIGISGRVSRGLITGTASIKINPTINEQGNPEFVISSASMGSLPIPDFLLDQFSTFLNESFSNDLDPAVTGITIHDINIEAGIMTVTGRKQ